ncbi:sensor histidine kinase [Streptomyces prunicolor]|uniref:histidine kinase n=1 Tax=Streptomyces prunicolor TaxID=67348 RepID=A0ABU4FMD6_9ACTN|nr:sensor histidine kinase [Streptomyces prunicolor]MDV7221709.1 sensor histidine kinase [Streptomyces prunicolor]
MIHSLQRLLRCHPRTVDLVVAAALFVCSFPGSALTLPGRDLEVPRWPGVLVASVASLAVLWRRTLPRTTVVVTLGCAMAVAALGYILTVLVIGPLMIALYTLALRTDRTTANLFTVSGITLLVGTALVVGPGSEPLVMKLLGPAFWLLLPTSLGTTTRLRAAYLEAVQARAGHAERTREQEARHRVTEERMRIARDLHDVVAHHLVLANLQAGTVVRLMRSRPEEAERIAGELAGTTLSAVRELKATVGLLRKSDGSEAPSGPAPGLAQLAELAASFEPAGLSVTVNTVGGPRPLSAGADLTAYRIVQEALTNVTKHAGTGTAEVRLSYAHDRLSITVTDHGGTAMPSSASGSGYGVIGMRERALSAGGRLRAGHRPEGGFEVVTELPLLPHPQGRSQGHPQTHDQNALA